MRTRARSVAAALAVAWSMAFGGSARAQTPTAPPSGPQPSSPNAPGSTNAPGAGTAASAPGATPAPSANAAPNANAAPEEDPADKVRFRFAVHLAGGPWILPGKTGGAGGLGLQLGVQVNDLVGIYYSPMAAVGVAYGAAGAFVYNTIQGDVTLARILQLGAGPSFDSFAFGGVDVNKSGGSAVAVAGTFIGVNARAGVALGANKPGKRGVFMLGLEVHPTFISGSVPTTVFVTLGGGSF